MSYDKVMTAAGDECWDKAHPKSAAPDAAAHDEPPTVGWRRWAWVDGEGRLSIMKPNATRAEVAELGEPDERLIRVQITEVGRDAAEEK